MRRITTLEPGKNLALLGKNRLAFDQSLTTVPIS
jgi:hypothetical protein